MEKEPLSNYYEEEKLKLPETLSGLETAKLAESLYSQLDPVIANRLVDPNVVLTLAGLKGVADIPWIEPISTNGAKIDAVNEQFESRGLFFRYDVDRQVANLDNFPEDVGSLSLINLKGIEKATKQSKLPGMIPYDSRTGLEGYTPWIDSCNASIEAEKEQGRLDPELQTWVILSGKVLGYPDQAVMDFEEAIRTDQSEKLKTVKILDEVPFANHYRGAIPEFDYRPEHADDTDIVAFRENAINILQEFYDSEWHKSLSENEEFLAARQRGIDYAERMNELRRTLQDQQGNGNEFEIDS